MFIKIKLIKKVHPERSTLKETALRNLACQECSSKILPDAVFCAKCHAPIVRRYCAGCSKLVPENSAYCPFCGVSAKAVVKEYRGLATTLIPAAVCLTLLMFFVARREPSSKHAAASRENVTATTLVPSVVSAATASMPSSKTNRAPGLPSQVGRQLNLEAHELMKQRRFDEAIPLLVRALKELGDDPKDAAYPYVLFNLGQSLRMTGQAQKALRVLQKALELDPANPLFQHEVDAAQNMIAPRTASNRLPQQ